MSAGTGTDRLPVRETQARMLIKVAVVLVVLATAVAGAVAWSAAEAGIATVHVKEKGDGGHSFWLPVPMGLAAAAVHMAPDDMLEDESDRDIEDLQTYLPMLAAALDELEDAGDFTLVEIEGPGEHVRIDKSGRSLLIHVEDEEDEVRVKFPIRSFARLFREVEVKAGHEARARAKNPPAEIESAEAAGTEEEAGAAPDSEPAPAKTLSY